MEEKHCRRCGRKLKDGGKQAALEIGRKCRRKEQEEENGGIMAEIRAAGFDGDRDPKRGGIQLAIKMN